MSRINRPRNFRFPDRLNMPTATSTFDYVNSISEALNRAVSPFKKPCAVIEERVGRSARAAKNWLTRENGPGGPELVDLIREFDEVYEAVMLMANRSPHPVQLSPEEKDEAMMALRKLMGRSQ